MYASLNWTLPDTRVLVLASDGLWNMVRPQECIDIVHRIDKENENLVSHK